MEEGLEEGVPRWVMRKRWLLLRMCVSYHFQFARVKSRLKSRLEARAESAGERIWKEGIGDGDCGLGCQHWIRVDEGDEGLIDGECR